MSSSALAAGLRHLRGKLAAQEHREDGDEQLLHAFTSRRDDSAFAALVRRHGPMVLHVCCRVLGHEEGAEDAFQATFLVLAQRAATLRNKRMLASFLHGIAYRTAMKAKQSAARRRKHEGARRGLTQPRSPIDPTDELSWREARTLLDEEIARLPEKYRVVFVLFYLEDLSREETARRLGLKDFTEANRLAEARKRLGQRLARRGVELTAVLAATAVATPPASAVPVELMAGTIRAALAMTMGENLAGIVSASVAELVEGMTAAMIANKVKIATVVLLAVSLLTVATSGSLVSWYGRASGPLAATEEPPAAKADDKPRTISPKRETAKSVEIRGRVLDPDGKPKAGAKLLLLGESGKPRQLGTTATDGRFRIPIPKEAKASYLIAQAEDFGIDFLDFPKGDPKKQIEFRLVKDRPIRGRILNTEGKPVAGARLALRNLDIYADNSMDSFAVTCTKCHVGDAPPRGVKHIWGGADQLFAATTDADGRFVLSGLGAERLVTLRLRRAGIADGELRIINRSGFDPKPYNQASLDRIPKGQEHLGQRSLLLHSPDLTAIVEAEKILRGMVKDADTGKGLPGVLVLLTHRDGGELLLQRPEARTDAQGRYEIRGAHKAKSYMLEVFADPTAGYLPCQTWADDTAGYRPIPVDIAVKKRRDRHRQDDRSRLSPASAAISVRSS
jgi:RNA polymerase sigma factor (sigma-70 family)